MPKPEKREPIFREDEPELPLPKPRERGQLRLPFGKGSGR